MTDPRDALTPFFAFELYVQGKKQSSGLLPKAPVLKSSRQL